jgi:predicted PurR-regulated permease PerM
MEWILLILAAVILVAGAFFLFAGEFVIFLLSVFTAIILFVLYRILDNQQEIKNRLDKLYGICYDLKENDENDKKAEKD